MAATAQELKDQVEERRRAIDDDLSALSDKVSPGKAARRRAGAVGSRVGAVKDAVMGTASGATEPVRDGVAAVASGATSLPAQVTSTTRGNPWGAGIAAFGLGLVVAALLPASEAERRAAAAVDPHLDALAGAAAERGREAVDGLAEPARRAAGELADDVREHAAAVTDTASPGSPA